MGNIVTLSKGPNEYLKQDISSCGFFSAKAILESFSINAPSDPKHLHVSPFNKITGVAFPSRFKKIFENHCLKASIGRANKMSNTERVQMLKNSISRGNRIMLGIGHGYRKDGTYSNLRRALFGHWITIWGYDGLKQEFYIYDPTVSKERFADIPLGNAVRSFEDLLRDWKGAFYLFPYSYLYIEVTEG